MSKDKVTVFKDSVIVNSMNYIKPNMEPDKDGDIHLVTKLCFGPIQSWEWSINKEGKFFVEYKWLENELFEDDSFKVECSQEEMIKKMQEMQTFFADYDLDEYVEIYKCAEAFVREYRS